MRPGKGSPWARQEIRPLRLEDIADRLGDRVEMIRASLDGHEDVAVVGACEPGSGSEVLLIATRRGILVAYPWSGPADTVAAIVPSGWVAWGDARASTVQTVAASGTSNGAANGGSTATAVVSHHSCTILLRGVGLTAQGDGDQGRRAVDAFHDEVVRRGTPWHYPS